METEVLLALGTKNGYIFLYDLVNFFYGISPIKDRRLDINANAFRNEDVDGIKYFPLHLESITDSDIFKEISVQTDIPKVPESCLRFRKKIHGKESINLIKFIKIQEIPCLVSCSLDGFAKISTLGSAELICSMNICNPLPAIWDIKYTKNRKRFNKIKKAIDTLKVINNTFRGIENKKQETNAESR